ncbi:MAG: hypothetical protein ACYCQJ_01650 [Nitrososphaerales archaeon]
MSAVPLIDITTISLILTGFTLAFVIVVFVILFRRQRLVDGNSQLIDAKVVVEEFGARERRLEQRLVEQKVKLEILELRLSKSNQIVEMEQRPLNAERIAKERSLNVVGHTNMEKRSSDFDKRLGLDQRGRKSDGIRLEMLKAVFEGDGKATAKDVQDKIGRSREHTARMMNVLFREGLVSRNGEVRPFSYTITDAGRSELGL